MRKRRVDSLALLIPYVFCIILSSGGPHCMLSATAEDVPFHPRFDGIEHRSKKQSEPTPISNSEMKEIYSFDRFSGSLKQVCDLLESDGRKTRVYEMARERLRDPSLTKSYRALLKEIVLRCKPKLDVPSDQSPRETPETESTPKPAARYPSTALLDRVSALSSSMYERDAGVGPVFLATRELADNLRKETLNIPAERDYFAIFNEYLLSAWQGRPEAPLEPTQPSQTDIHSLFQ